MLSFMASHGYPLGLALIQEQQGLCRVAKENQTLLPSFVTGKEIIRLGSNLKPCGWEDPWKVADGLDSKQFLNVDSIVRKPTLIDKLGDDKVLQFLVSASCEVTNGQVNVAFLSDMTKLEAIRADVSQQSTTPLIHTGGELYSEKLLIDLIGDLERSSIVTIQPDGQVIFSGSEIEKKDLISVVAGFYLSNNVKKWRTQSVLIPHFDRLDCPEARVRIAESPLLLEATKVVPLKSPEKVKRKQSSRKRNTQSVGRERDIYKGNYFHACESLLTLMMDKRHCGRTTILSLKKSGPELHELLTQFSASIAGTGLAVVFSVICKMACGRAPFCASKLVSTGLGFGLVWLASAVNRLRDAVIYISKNAGKSGLKGEEMVSRVNRSLNEIFFRAATLMAVAMLRFA